MLRKNAKDFRAVSVAIIIAQLTIFAWLKQLQMYI